jgi:hypothetical protein
MDKSRDAKNDRADDAGPVTVGTYADQVEASLARAVLEQAGIQCFLYDENAKNLGIGYIQLGGGMRLVVAASDAENAKALLSESGDGRGAPLR